MIKRYARLLLAAGVMLAYLLSNAPGAQPVAGAASPRAPKSSSPSQSAQLSLADFGAVGDNVADDGPALQAALDALASAGGGTLLVPAGRYAIVTPVSKDFTGLASSISILGVPSDTPVPPPTAPGNELTHGLDLVSEFRPKTEETAAAIRIAGLDSFLLQDISFMGTPGVATDAVVTLVLDSIDDATVRHCEFYGLSAAVWGGAIVLAARTDLKMEQCVFLGSSGTSGTYVSLVQNILWKGVRVEDTIFADYGQRPELFGKNNVAPYSWVNIANAAQPEPDSPRREVVVRGVFFDEGALAGLSSLPYSYQPPTAPIDLIYVSDLFMNVANLNTSGHYLEGAGRVMIEKSHYGWSHLSDSAINLVGVGEAILDEVECVADANRIRADADTGKLTVINSVYTHLDSLAGVTNVINTATPDEDPVQHVRAQYEQIAGREPDAAGHFYWSNMLLGCGANAQCAAQARAALAAFLAGAPPADFSISGQVLDEGGEPVPGVAFTLSGSQSVTTETDADGRYRFSGLPTSGVYTVTPSKQHYTFGQPGWTFTTPTGDQTLSPVGTLDRYTISGRLANSANVAVAGATVTLSGSQSGTATTDAAGNYSFANLPAGGSYTLTPSKASHTFAPASRTFSDLSSNLTANFVSSLVNYKLSGRITSGGAALAGVTVTLSGLLSNTTTTDAAGDYSFTVPAEGSYTVTPAKAHYTFQAASATFQNLAANQTANFAATPVNYKLSGRVTSGGVAVAGATVTLSGSQSGTATTDAAGNYSFNSLPALGNYAVTPSKAHYTFAPASTTFQVLSANQTANFTATPVNYKLSGRVTSGGAGLAGVTMTLSGSLNNTAVTDAAGDYSFTVPAEGDYTVTPAKAHYTFAATSATFNDLVGNQSANFTATPVNYKISGRVTSGGVALAGATVTLTGSQAATTTTDAAGDYSFTVPAVGNYNVTASKKHYTFVAGGTTLNNLSGNQTADFSGTLNRHAVMGRVATVNNYPMAGVAVTLSGTQGATTTTDAAGSYSFVGLPAGGNYTVTPSFKHHSFTPSVSTFNDLGSDQYAEFAATHNTHTISGRVTSVGGVGMSGVAVRLDGPQTASVVTGADGVFSFAGLGAGGNYAVTPTLPKHTFTPAALAFGDLGANQSVTFAGALTVYTLSGRVTEKGAGLGGVTVTLSGSQSGTATTAAGGEYSFSVTAGGSYTVTPSKKDYLFAPAGASFANLSGNQSAHFAATLQTVIEFSAATLSADEGAQGLYITVTRRGDTSGTTTVVYSASNGTAHQGNDLSTVIGLVTFAPGETSQTVPVFIIDDAFIEGSEHLTFSLSDPDGATIGAQSVATLTINDNDSAPSPTNPVDDTRFFVRQHYRDFLNREPDAAGLDFWANEIEQCGADQQCRAVKRVNVSAAFFLSIEFQETGFLVHRLYEAAYGRAPRRVDEFLLDARLIGGGVVVGTPGWQQKLAANKEAFVAGFVARAEFTEEYPASLTPAQFVNLLNANAGHPLTPEEVTAAIGEFDNSDADARGRVLRLVAESAALRQREFNRAFVRMQYVGYLQRGPDDPPDDANLVGYNFWLKKLDDNGGDFQKAEMVRAFIESIEYRTRFAP